MGARGEDTEVRDECNPNARAYLFFGRCASAQCNIWIVWETSKEE